MKAIKLFIGVCILASALFQLQGCMSDDDEFDEQDRYYQDLETIDKYLSENGIQAQTDSYTGIRYVIHDQGTGLMPYILDSVTLSYEGRLLSNDSIFETVTQSKKSWKSLLTGIQLALTKIQEGGSVTAYIPSYYGYGEAESGDVPANSILIVDVQLHQIHSRQLLKDIAIIDDSLSAWGINATKHPSGIRYTLDQGTGDSPTLADNMTVNYAGRLLGATENFDSGENVTFSLSSLIPGWQVIMPLVKEGGSVTMYLPSSFAYGKNGSGTAVPPNANLIFDVDLIEVK